LYNKIFKNSQITYGIPFQVKIPINFQNLNDTGGYGNYEMSDEQVDPDNPDSIVEKAKEEAKNIKKEAEYEAARTLKSAEDDAEKKVRDLEDEAWQKGYGEGLEAAAKHYEELTAQAEALKKSAEEEHEIVLAGMETEIVDMVLQIARKVVGTELSTNRDCILNLVVQTLEGCANRKNMILKVSAEDFDYIMDNKDKLYSMVESANEIEIKKEMTLKQGNCIVETSYGSIDGSAGTKLAKIEDAFKKLLGS
jgi:flagellar assembly protein FliH